MLPPSADNVESTSPTVLRSAGCALNQARPSLSSMHSLSGELPGLAFIAVLPPGAAPDVQSSGAAQNTLQGGVNAPACPPSLGGSREGDGIQQSRAADAAAAASPPAADGPGPQHAPAAADTVYAPGNRGEAYAHAPPARYNKSLLRGVLQLMGCKQRHAHKASASLLLLSRQPEQDAVPHASLTASRRLVGLTMAPNAPPLS